MSENRDFKGVWIPKEIWLNEELTALDKVIFTEISSLDNEDHCRAGNEYLAEFCKCSERKVSDAVKKLTDMGLIEIISFDGRHRIIRVEKSAKQGRKICDSPSKNLQAINIDNNISNNKYNNKELLYDEMPAYGTDNDFLCSKPKKKSPVKRKSLYEKCADEIDLFSTSLKTRQLLLNYLTVRLQMKDKPIYGVNQWKSMLMKLKDMDNIDAVINQSIEKGWATFYPIKSYNSGQKDVFGELGIVESVKDRGESSGNYF